MAADSEVSVNPPPLPSLSLPSVPQPPPPRSPPAPLSPQPESEVFEITDFTTASEWERYVLLRDRGEGLRGSCRGSGGL